MLFNFCGMIFNFLVVVTTPTVAKAVAQHDFERVGLRLTTKCLASTTICWPPDMYKRSSGEGKMVASRCATSYNSALL